jgi:hypothetical protein
LKTTVSPNPFEFKRFRTLCKIPGIGCPFTQSVLREGPSFNKKGKSMTQNSANSSSISDLPRCQHHFRSGSQCRLTASGGDSTLCAKHARAQQKLAESSGSVAELTEDIGGFESAYEVHELLSRLQQLLSEKRISPRLAGVMAYISSLHLRTLAAINRADEDDKVTIIMDAPRPDRSKDQDYSPAIQRT